MKKLSLHISGLLLLLIFITSCSTNKNTASSRRYHAMLTRYNIAFNGNNSFKEGLENIEKSNQDNYSQTLPLFAISNHSNATSATSNMDRSIEKSRKAIKMHSIKKKPVRDYKKMNDPKYRAFYNQNEFNPELKKAWIQLGKAEFYKGEFLGAAGTFSYIIRHYEAEPEVVTEAQLWMARSYCELDWIYEAEDILKKVRREHITSKNEALYAATSAQLLMKQEERAAAFEQLKVAAKIEKNKTQKRRYYYVLAQIAESLGQKSEAASFYNQVLKSSPPYIMDFNARINRVQLLAKNSSSASKELKRMARNRNNKDYLDQVYTALGNIYLNEKDTVKALQYYDLAIEESTRNSFEKAVPLVIAGDLHYGKKEYVEAHPYYDEASKIYTAEHNDFQRINHRADVLGELVKEYEMVHLQDSLQALAAMPEKERLEAINRVIDKIKADEKSEQDSKLAAAARDMDEDFRMPMQQIGGSGSNWYFYNPNSVNSGKSEFRRRWGNRKLEDNWRRVNKSAALMSDYNNEQLQTDSLMTESAANDTINGTAGTVSNQEHDPNIPVFEQTSDRKSVDYYLAQIPFTAAQKERSNVQIAEGLYNMGFVYKDQIEDYPLTYETFEKFEKRFPEDERIPETLFQRFLLASKEGKEALAGDFRSQILSRYPESKQAETLADPDYISNQQRMFEVQDKLYNSSYTAFTKSEYPTVFANTKEIKTKYPFSTLLPQFEFLNTLSIGKTAGAEEFEESLNALVENYPGSTIGAMSKDILALLKQGNIAQHGSTFGSLLTRRDQEKLSPEELKEQSFSELKFTPHRMLFISHADDDAINKMQYNLAIFNFSRFMIKDFSFSLTLLEDGRRALSVHNLASYNEGIWYRNTLDTDIELNQMFEKLEVQQIIISEENFGKLRNVFTLDEYLAFEEEVLTKDVPESLLAAAEKPVEKPKETHVEIIDGTKLVEKKEDKKVVVSDSTDVDLALNDSVIADKAGDTLAQKTDTAVKPQTPAENKKQEEKTVTPQTPAREQQQQEKRSEPVSEKSSILDSTPVREKGVELYKNLFAITPNAPHYVAFYIPRGGKFDYEKVKQALDEFNASNYGTMNLKVTLEESGRENIIFVSTFADLNVAKSYFLRMLKEPAIIRATSGMNKRNLLVTRDNLNTMVQNNALDVYFEFMREYYLKP